jgi:hypothetical protein
MQGVINSLANTMTDSSGKINIDPKALPNGTIIFDNKTGRPMIKTEDGLQALYEGLKPTIRHEERLVFPDGTRIIISLENVTTDVADTARFKAYVGEQHIRFPQIEGIIALGFPVPDSDLHLFDNLSLETLRGEDRKSVAFSVEFTGGNAIVDVVLLAASVSHLHKPIVGHIAFEGGVAICEAVRSHTGDLSLGKNAFEHFKTEFERYTVILS